jgi:ATP-dependent helicase HepA
VIEFREGQFVRVADDRLGIGKVLRASGDDVAIEYFDSVSPTGRHRQTASRNQVEPVRLSLQRRCYWEDKRGWRVGRVVWQGGEEYGVRPPDSDLDLRLTETDLYVRWDKPIEDPIDVLVAHGNESPHFHRCRQPFVATITEQRAASHGMSGVISSVIELHEHQIEVARRVLEDPKQRYLLADEVGLGKTIEAGLIIRQYLLDHPDGHVVVIAPPLLRRQWMSELRQKFLIDDFDRAVVSVLSHDNIESWRGGARDTFGRLSPHSRAGLVVVDEVHHLAALANVEGNDGSAYATLAELTTAVPRLLLLSATPLLNNERTFLAMLHLLDPEIYQLSDLEGFRRRVRDRAALGTAFFTFRHDVPAFLLREKVTALRAMFPEDAQLSRLLDAVSNAIDAPSVLADAVTAARIHISEIYRVHRRLLRTRRDDALLRTFPVLGRQQPGTIAPATIRDAHAQEWLDDWREYIRAGLDDSGTTRHQAMVALVALAGRAASHPTLLAAAAGYRLEPSSKQAYEAELTVEEQTALRAWEIDAAEREILTRGSALEVDGEPARAVLAFLNGVRRKTVVFASFTATARYLQACLKDEFGVSAVASHVAEEDPAMVEEQLDRFRETDGACWILVCDRSAEEGRNLQFAEQAIHFDFPLFPNRLEQRIGRLDRYGRGHVIPTYAIESGFGTIARAWEACLAKGFQVFDGSIASLQFAVDALLPEVHGALLDDGALGLERITEQLPDRLASERAAIQEQDALDAIEVATREGGLTTAVDDVEDMWFQIQRATEGLLCDEPGNLRFHRVIDAKDKRYRSYRMTAPGKAVNLNSMPLVAWDVLGARFRPVVQRAGTYFRRAATARSGVRLFRVGEPLVDALADYMRWDDRGQTFAFWRASRRVAEESLYFRFDYLVEADTEVPGRDLESRGEKLDVLGLQRRADAFFAPTIATIWTTIEGKELDDARLLELVEPPYDPKRGDLNLNEERRWALDELVGEDDWERHCRTARARSEQALRGRDDFSSACEAAANRFEAVSRVAHTQRRVRLAFLAFRERAAEESELSTDVDFDAALAAGMRSPEVRLDAVGALVLSPFLPDGPGFPRPLR